jgi:hypothetical protein
MGINGTLQTISLPDLLHWASSSRKTGILEVERNKIRKSIAFREGRIVACSSGDPSCRIGQFLLARGKISQDDLREALSRQETTRQPLGAIFREMGLLSEEEIDRQIVAKAEEIVYSLFDWPDAAFRFQEEAEMDPYAIEIHLAVEDILFEGIQRHEELEQVRRSFTSMGVVLARTDKPTPSEVQTSPLASLILGSVNGERTLAEILLCAHASEYQAIRFLYMLHRTGVVEVTGERPVDPHSPTLLDARLVPADPLIETEPDESADESAIGPEVRALAEDASRTDAPAADPRAAEEEILEAARRYPELGAAIELAARLGREGDHASALRVLNQCYRSHPGDGYLRHLIFKAEAAYMANLDNHGMSRSMIPVPIRPVESIPQEKLRPTELFLMEQIDGKSDIKSILWVVPMREVDVYLSLQQMRDHGFIELTNPEAVEEEAERTGTVLWT